MKGFVPCRAWAGEFGAPGHRPGLVHRVSIGYGGPPRSIRRRVVGLRARWHAYAGRTRLPTEPARGLIRIALTESVPDRVVLRYEIDRRPPLIGAVAGAFCLLMGAAWAARLSRLAPASNAANAPVAITGA